MACSTILVTGDTGSCGIVSRRVEPLVNSAVTLAPTGECSVLILSTLVLFSPSTNNGVSFRQFSAVRAPQAKSIPSRVTSSTSTNGGARDAFRGTAVLTFACVKAINGGYEPSLALDEPSA